MVIVGDPTVDELADLSVGAGAERPADEDNRKSIWSVDLWMRSEESWMLNGGRSKQKKSIRGGEETGR